MNWDRVKALIIKDIRDYTKSKYVLISIIVLPLFFSLLMAFSGVYPLLFIEESEDIDDLNSQFIDNAFGSIVPRWHQYSDKQKILVFTSYMMLVFLVLIPMIVPSVIASETLVGEKERKTMESLLASPLTEKEIVTGKILSSFIPAVLCNIVALGSYIIIIDLMLYFELGNHLLFPDLLSIYMLFILGPLTAIIVVELMIILSTKVNTVRDSYQFGSLISLPLMVLIFSQLFMYMLSSWMAIIVGTVILLITALVFFKLAENVFDREKALTKLV